MAQKAIKSLDAGIAKFTVGQLERATNDNSCCLGDLQMGDSQYVHLPANRSRTRLRPTINGAMLPNVGSPIATALGNTHAVSQQNTKQKEAGRRNMLQYMTCNLEVLKHQSFRITSDASLMAWLNRLASNS